MWVRDLHCHYGLVRIAFGVYNIKVMKKLIKESIVAAMALTSIVLFMAAAVITFYKLFGY